MAFALVLVAAMLVTFVIDQETGYVIEPVTWIAMGAGVVDLTVDFNQNSNKPEVIINPWTSPPGNTWETTDIWIDSPVNGYGTFRYGTWSDLAGGTVPAEKPVIGPGLARIW